jgi:hypothetical protein
MVGAATYNPVNVIGPTNSRAYIAAAGAVVSSKEIPYFIRWRLFQRVHAGRDGVAARHGLDGGGREHGAGQNEGDKGRAEIPVAAARWANGDRHEKARRETSERPLTLQLFILSKLPVEVYGLIAAATSGNSICMIPAEAQLVRRKGALVRRNDRTLCFG